MSLLKKQHAQFRIFVVYIKCNRTVLHLHFISSSFIRCSQLNTKVAKLGQELREEQEMNRCLRANQQQLQTKLQEEEIRGKDVVTHKDTQIAELQEQLRDVMFYLETQQQISRMPAETRQEIQEGQINIAAAPASSTPGPSAHGSGKTGSRKGRAKRGK